MINKLKKRSNRIAQSRDRRVTPVANKIMQELEYSKPVMYDFSRMAFAFCPRFKPSTICESLVLGKQVAFLANDVTVGQDPLYSSYVFFCARLIQ